MARRKTSPLSTRFASRCAWASCLNSLAGAFALAIEDVVDRRAQLLQEGLVDECGKQHESLLVELPPLLLRHGGHARGQLASVGECRLVGGRLARLDDLFQRVAEPDQLRLTIGAAHEREADGQAVAVAERDRQARRARRRRPCRSRRPGSDRPARGRSATPATRLARSPRRVCRRRAPPAGLPCPPAAAPLSRAVR